MTKVTLIVPCYNEEGNIAPFYEAAVDTFEDLEYELELIFVDDGSGDGTYKAINKLIPEQNMKIECVSFSRNFGKEAAIYAGLQRSQGDYTVIIDADMQQDPHLIPAMLDVIENDAECDSVVYYQASRRESKLLSLCKGAFYRLINHVSDVEFRTNASDFRLMNRRVVAAILDMPEVDRFSKGIFEWVGFNKTYLPYTPAQRLTGSSKWDFFSLMRYAFSGITSFSTKPMKWAFAVGLMITVAGAAVLAATLVQASAAGGVIPRYMLIAGLVLFVGGLQLMFMGIYGYYSSNAFKEIKKRPMYIARDDHEISRKNIVKIKTGKEQHTNDEFVYKVL